METHGDSGAVELLMATPAFFDISTGSVLTMHEGLFRNSLRNKMDNCMFRRHFRKKIGL